MFNNEKSFFLVMLKIARKLVCFRDIAHKSESCSFPAGFRDKAIGTFLKQFQEFIYSQVSCSSSSSSRSSYILRRVVLPQEVPKVYHSQVKGSPLNQLSQNLSTLRLKVFLQAVSLLSSFLHSGWGFFLKQFNVFIFSHVRASFASCFWRLSYLRWGIIPQACSPHGLSTPRVWDSSPSSSRSFSTSGSPSRVLEVCRQYFQIWYSLSNSSRCSSLWGSFSSMSRSLSTLRIGMLLQEVPGNYLVSGRFQYLIYSQVRRKNSS